MPAAFLVEGGLGDVERFLLLQRLHPLLETKERFP
jgi:hypothetical protein